MLLKTFIAAGLSYFSVATLFFFIAMVRIMIRKATRCEKYSLEFTDCFDRCKPIDRMLWYILFNWMCGAGWGVVLWWIYDAKEPIIWGCCGWPCILFFLRGCVYFSLNDFEYL